MKTTIIPAGEIEDRLHRELSRELSDYTIAIGRVRNREPQTFQIIGSGVCVVRDGFYGILTAHHCLHECSPEIKLGKQGTDELIFVVRMGRTICVDPFELIEREVGPPRNLGYTEYGPDLTFIEIPAGPRLSRFKSIVSFWDLNRRPGPVRRKYCVERAYLAAVGFPASAQTVAASKRKVEASLGHILFVGPLERKDIKIRGGWDFVDLVTNERTALKLPPSFGGISGGPMWVVRLLQKRDKTVSVTDFCLVGIIFYEIRAGKDERRIRGHFVRSIYSRAWKCGR